MIEDERHRWLAMHMGIGPTAPLSEADVDALAAIMSVQKVAAGDVLFSRDEDLREVFVLESGRIALARPNADRTSFLNLLEPGDVFGDVGQLIGRLAPVDAVVLEDAVVLSMPGAELIELLMTRPRIAMRWMASMAERLAVAQDRLEELLSGPLDYQLASMLLHLSDASGIVPVSQQVIAQLLGSRRPSVARSLATLEHRGLIEKQYRRITIVDPEALRSLVGQLGS